MNKFFLILFAALTFFTPFYSYRKMVFLLACFAAWYLTAIMIDSEFMKESVPVILFLVAFVFLDLLRGFIIDDPVAMLLGVNKMPNYVWILVFQFYSTRITRIKMRPVISWLLVLFTISAFFTLKGNIQYPIQ